MFKNIIKKITHFERKTEVYVSPSFGEIGERLGIFVNDKESEKRARWNLACRYCEDPRELWITVEAYECIILFGHCFQVKMELGQYRPIDVINEFFA